MALVGSPYVLQLNRNANPGLLTERGTSYLPDAARRILPLQQNCRVILALATGHGMPIARHVMPNFLPQSNCDRALGHTPERGTAGYPPLYSGFGNFSHIPLGFPICYQGDAGRFFQKVQPVVFTPFRT